MMPEEMAVTTEACPLCMSFIAATIVKNITKPPTSITAHWLREGTTNFEAAKKAGNSIAQKKTSWCVIAYGFDDLSRDISVFSSPKRMPGTNQSSLVAEQLCSRRTEPTMTDRKKNLQLPMRLPFSDSQAIANRIPPEPFQPMKTLRMMAAQSITQLALRRLSLVLLGRQGMSSKLRMTARQLYRKLTRKAKYIYCNTGIAKYATARNWATISTGTKITRDSVDRVIFGQLLTSLYSQSCQSIPATIDANLLILGVRVGISLSLIRFSLRFLLAIQITNIITIPLHYPTSNFMLPAASPKQ